VAGVTPDEFLLARFADDEAVARALTPDEQRYPYGDRMFPPTPFEKLGDELRGYLGGPLGEHAARWHPARVLAECEAKRRIVELHTGGHGCVSHNSGGASAGDAYGPNVVGSRPCPTLRLLALPYADHPDFQQEWLS
jgi:hypothetical protein